MTPLIEALTNSDSIYEPIPARITGVRSLTDLEKVFTVELPGDLSLLHEPGQFVEVSVLGVGEAPISISSSPSKSNGTFELCVRRVGDVTGVLHTLEAGDIIGIRGPFGRGFPLERFCGKDLLFVAGGLGMAPLRSLINQVLDERGNYGRLLVVYGTRDPDGLLFTNELSAWDLRADVELHLTVDEPDPHWQGQVGVITTLFDRVQIDPRNTVAVVVGPPVMYRFVIQELLEMGLADANIWLSFERRMKCGVGKCGHCQLNHLYTCQAGPSFSYDEIKNLEEAL